MSTRPRTARGPRKHDPAAQLAALRTRHLELQASHREALARLAAGVESDATFHKVGWFALERSSSAVALYRDGRVVLGNRRWRELASARSGHRGWVVVDGKERRRHPELGTLGAVELARRSASAAGAEAAALTAEREDGRQVLRIRIEHIARRHQPADGLVLVDDITVEKARELEMATLRQVVARKERMRALGRLAAGVVHDLGNTINALALQLRALERHLGDGDGQVQPRLGLASISEAVALMRATLDRLDRFAGRGAAPVEPLRLAPLVENAVELVRLDLARRKDEPAIDIVVDVSQRLPRVLGHAPEVTNVFVNLLLNARDAMPRGGTIAIGAEARDSAVVVRVRDEGSGIDPALFERVFEPFFTTKGADGSGLGLSLAYRTLDALGGSISAGNRSDGAGAELTLQFPRVSRLDGRMR